MDNRFLKENGTEVFTGNELLLKGGLEGRLALLTGYPGSPVSDVFDSAQSINKLLKEKGILAEMANNEALSAARLNGAQMGNLRAMAVMKSVGLHVAADGLALGNLAEPNNDGGAVVVVGDDPWMESTQINNDSRYLLMHLHMPVFEPSTFQEIKDWIDTAFEFSSAANLYIGYLISTNQADGGGVVQVWENHYPSVNTKTPFAINTQTIALEDMVLLPPRTWQKEATLGRRHAQLLELARLRQINKILYKPSEKKPLGFVSSGLSYLYLEEALRELGLEGAFPILKWGVTYPLDPVLVEDFSSLAESFIVVEEKRGFLEMQINQTLKDLVQNRRLSVAPPVWGKNFPGGLPGFPELRGLNVSVILEHLIPLLEKTPGLSVPRENLAQEAKILQEISNFEVSIPARTPTFCPGCPHRDSSAVFLAIKKDFRNKDYMKKVHKKDPIDLVFHGGAGCYTMLMFEPNKELMHNYSGMGLEGGTGAGIDPFITNKQIVFMGDSTFFHSGMIAISDSLKNNQDVTYVILDNKTTAMTGHQPTPGIEEDLMGNKTFVQKIDEIVKGMSHRTELAVVRVNPEYRDSYRELLEETILQDGVKVVVADKECGITFHRKLKREKRKILLSQGYLPVERHINITPEVCEYCLECTKSTGCPGLTIEETDYGPKIVTDPSTCVSDGACTRGKACPSFEEVTIQRRRAPENPLQSLDLENIPEPALAEFDDVWRIYTAAVGGMGAGIVTSILVQAGHRQGYHVLFSDKKGLAVRNGGVYGHIIYRKTQALGAPLIPYGKADVLLGIDLLEAVRGLDPKVNLRVAHPERTAAITNTAKTPTILTLLGQDNFDPADLEKTLKTYTDRRRYFGENFSELSQRYLGSKLYVNMMLLGAAFQRGVLPLAVQTLRWAFEQTFRPEDLDINWSAFQLGRKTVYAQDSFRTAKIPETYRSTLHQKAKILESRWGGRALAQEYLAMVEQAVQSMDLHDTTNRHLAIRVYDLIQFEGPAYAREFLRLVSSVYRKDHSDWDYQATRTVIWNLHKVMIIKDEVYVARLLTSPEKHQRDKERFQVDESRGDILTYRHINRPRFTLWGKDFEFDWKSRQWHLRVMKHLKFLRQWLPQWHAKEKEFRQWYQELVQNFEYDDQRSYQAYVTALAVPETVRGYREIRWQRMEEAKKAAAMSLAAAQNMAVSRNLAGRSKIFAGDHSL